MLSLEYIAGFIDGEGGFGIYPKSVRMTVSNAHRDVLEQIAEVIGGGRITERLPEKETHGTCYQLEVGSLLLREFLPRIIPHLIVKRRLAEIVVEYLDPIPYRGSGKPFGGVPCEVTPDELDRRRRLRGQVRDINASGGRIAWGAARGV